MENRVTDEQIMTFEKAMFILRHGSCEGEHKYLEAGLVIEEEVNRQKAEIERLNEKYSRMKFNLESVLAERADHTEAIKEFTSRIEGVLSLNPVQAKYYYEIKKEYIKEKQKDER